MIFTNLLLPLTLSARNGRCFSFFGNYASAVALSVMLPNCDRLLGVHEPTPDSPLINSVVAGVLTGSGRRPRWREPASVQRHGPGAEPGDAVAGGRLVADAGGALVGMGRPSLL